MSTTLVRKADVKRGWHVIDATDKPLGRMAASIARVLMGKHKVDYTPNADCGDYVIVVNAAKIRVDARSKWKTKEYQRYSFYPSGQKRIPFREMLEKHPERVIQLAVKRMLPKNKLSSRMQTRLKVYTTPDHPHDNFRPVTLVITK
ncbi:MAG: 50S ribosomal protein L13 [Phycisphaerae bacterium]|nr:50S ribosomal protein L13 [Phycisphaerae bacterium]